MRTGRPDNLVRALLLALLLMACQCATTDAQVADGPQDPTLPGPTLRQTARRCDQADPVGEPVELVEDQCGMDLGFHTPEGVEFDCSGPCCFDAAVMLAQNEEALAALRREEFGELAIAPSDWSEQMVVGVFVPHCSSLGVYVRVRAAAYSASGLLRLSVEHWGCPDQGDSGGRPYDVVRLPQLAVADLCMDFVEAGCFEGPTARRCTDDPPTPP